jgi:hypothetical protein
MGGCIDLFAPFYCDGGGTTTSTQQNYSPEESARRTQVMDEAAKIYNATAGVMGASPYPGSQPAPFSPQTLLAQDYATQYALGPAIDQANNINQAVTRGFDTMLNPAGSAARQYTEDLLGGLYSGALDTAGSAAQTTAQQLQNIASQPVTSSYDPTAVAGSSTAEQAAIDAATRAITESYTDAGGIMGQIRTGSLDAGQFGSSRQGIAEGIAAGRYFDSIGDTAAKIANEHQLQDPRLATDVALGLAGMNTDLARTQMGIEGQTKNNLMSNLSGLTEQQIQALTALTGGLQNELGGMYGQDADTFSRVLAFAPQALDTGLMPSNILSGIGAQNEMQQQQINDYLANAAMWDYNAPWTPLQNYASIVFGGANPTVSSSANTDPSALQTGSSLASLGMMAAMLYASDRRLKEKITLVGVDARTGLQIYDFHYLGDPISYRGVMADEVLEYMPEAVVTDDDGYMRVNYSLLGIPFIRTPKGEYHA